MSHLPRLTLAVLILASVTACNKREPRLPTPVALLEIPAPPARLVIPVELPDTPEPPPEVAEPPAPPPTPARRDPVATAKPTDKPAAPPTATAPQPVLRTTADTAAVEQRIQQLLRSAQQDLGQVNYRDLSADARAQYDAARSYIRQAGNAVKTKNYLFAETLASRAALLAGALVKG